jgi:hypothetical protein
MLEEKKEIKEKNYILIELVFQVMLDMISEIILSSVNIVYWRRKLNRSPYGFLPSCLLLHMRQNYCQLKIID